MVKVLCNGFQIDTMYVSREKGGQNMLQKIQRFGGAMFTPVLLFAFAGTTIGIGTLFTTEAIMGGLADPNGLWYQVWNVILQGG